MFKSNDIVRNQTNLRVCIFVFSDLWLTLHAPSSKCLSKHRKAKIMSLLLQGDRKISVLVAISVGFLLHVSGVYWWFQNDDLFYSLFMLPPKEIPPFWHAIFIILVNGMDLISHFLLLNCDYIALLHQHSKMIEFIILVKSEK